MIQMRHIGLYVNDLIKISEFYKQVFHMHIICENIEQKDSLVNEIFDEKNVSIKITKLITDQGKESGIDDMLELIEIKGMDKNLARKTSKIYATGCMHIGFGIKNIENVVIKIKELGGQKCTNICVMKNGNKCCFCQDPENNWLELIENKKEK